MQKDQDKKDNKTFLNGPSLGYAENLPKREMWKKIAEEYHGKFEIKHTISRDLEMHHISIPHKQWTIEISISDSRPLKVYVLFSVSMDFKFMLSQSDFLNKLFKKFSNNRVLLGWNEFDSRYLLESNRSDLVKRIFSREISKIILSQKIYSISYQANKKTRSAEMTSIIQRQAGNKEKMVELIEMFKELVDRMEEHRIIRN